MTPQFTSRNIPVKFWMLLGVAFVLLMLSVKPVVIGGDATTYADDVEKSLSRGWGDTHELWNFAHLIWRPSGRLLSQIFLNQIAPHFDGNKNMGIGFLLMLPDLIAALVCGFVLQNMIWKLTGNGWAALLTTCAFLCSSPLLHYSRVGSPYIVGITCTTIATYFACFHKTRSWGSAIFTGLFAGLAVLCWVPLLVSFPAILLSVWILDRKKEGVAKPQFAIVVCGVAGTLVAGCYLSAMGIAGIHGVSGLIAWMHESSQDSKDVKALRMITGMARCFYELGDDSIWLKWYRFHDPYAKVGALELIRGPLARVGLFYTSLLGLSVLLWRTVIGKRLLLFVAVAMLPHVGMALGYESGSPERYVGFLPALFLGFGYAMGSPDLSTARRIAATVFCCLHIPFNVLSASGRNLGNAVQKDPARLDVWLNVSPQSRLYVINGFDPLPRLSFGDPLNSLHKRRLAPVKVIGSFGRPAERWRVDFSCEALATWSRGGELWISKRFLAAQPQRSWLWVEGDIPGLTWNDMRSYFSAFDTSIQKGGSDGFFLLAATPETKQRLTGEIKSSGQMCDSK